MKTNNPSCIMIFGPGAVGKMTVGRELAKLTGHKLFHNHMTIEMLIRIFPHGTPEFKTLDKEFRFRIFEEMVKSEQRGIIFTFVFALDDENDWEYTNEIIEIFHNNGGEVFFVELFATQETRLRRNITSYRLDEKPSKRDLEFSRRSLLSMDEKYKVNSIPEEEDMMREKLMNYMKINNENLDPREVAMIIVDHFKFESNDGQ